MGRKLSRNFYRQDTALVARKLLGCRLVRVLPDGTRLSGLIVETEAYIGIGDRACHGFGNRRTKRTESLFQDGGFSYVYLIYGMYDCFNVVTRTPVHPEAVLIRAIQPDEGIELMKKHRRLAEETALTSGPGKLCQALAIDKKLDRVSLLGETLFIEQTDFAVKARDIVEGPRIGVDYAGEAAQWPLRFHLKQNPFVSKTPRRMLKD